jgi:hypothetical protein
MNNSFVNNTVNRINSMMNAAVTPATNIATNVMNNIKNGVNTPLAGPSASQNWIFVAIGIIFIIGIILFTTFYSSIVNFLPASFAEIFSRKEEVSQPILTSPEKEVAETSSEKIMNAVLPGKKEVFNVSSNRYTYADSAPLCKALGAELATYEQVKDAYGRGADWCNYGWVKGQMAVYPTQESTWDKLQGGMADERNSCGRPGVNGGYFDNPELRFGVNCYGTKPVQSAHDAEEIAAGAPKSPDALAFDKKVAEFKTDAGNLGILPFRESAWSE